MANLFNFVLVSILIFSCAKKPEYDTVFKKAEQTNRFKDFDTDSVYVYLPSTLDSPRNVSIKAPFYQGDETLVKLKWTKDGLSIYSSDKDNRFDFSRNQKPVFTIPGSYKAYRCSTNNLGECTNREEEDIETPWNKRPYFIPDLEDIRFSASLNSLDIYYGDNCVSEKKVRLKDYLIKKGVINIELEREFRINSSDACLSRYLKYEAFKLNTQDFSFKTTFFYSIVRLKDLASPDYEKFTYPLFDHDRFGFFHLIKKTLGDNFMKVKKEYLLNRWNPKRKFLTYHLSDSFNDPGMEQIKEITYKSVEDINKMLEKAEVPFKIQLKEPSGKKSGDLRQNMIVLITDPIRGGLLGYGPTVSNPITGELIQGHINMYSGVLTQMVPSVYDRMVRLSHNDLKIKFKGGVGAEPNISAEVDTSTVGNLRSQAMENLRATSKIEDPNLMMNPDYWSISSPFDPPKVMKRENTFKDRIDFFAKNNAYPMELYLSGGRFKDYLPGIKELKEIWHKNGTLINWNGLSNSLKKKVTKLIIPHTYRSTFIHEFGHNLGLRHNFMGSVDQEHFYKKEDHGSFFPDERSKTIDGETVYLPPQYSSIMDYGYSSLNELPIFGKYDIAALRYGYAKKVEVETNEGKKLVSLGKNGIKPINIPRLVTYQYCTDENVSTNPQCNRFDEGVTYTDIMNHYKEKYENDFYLTNFRNNSTNFNTFENLGYFWWRYSEFSRIREIFESYEILLDREFQDNKHKKSIQSRRDLITEKIETCEKNKDAECTRFLDLHNASTIAGEFFLDLLKAPEHFCIFDKEGRLVPITLRTLHMALRLIKAPKSCFDREVIKALKENPYTKTWVPVAERGRFITDLKENDPNYKFTTDISARGIWLDKALASQFLFGRNLPTGRLEDPELSFLEHPVIGPKMEKLAGNMFDQTEIKDGPFFLDSLGNEKKGTVNLFRSIRYNGIDNPEIIPQRSQLLNYFLSLPLRSTFRLNNVLINMAENYLHTTSPKISFQSKMDLDFFRVKKIADHIHFNDKIYSYSYMAGDGFIYAASRKNLIASYLIGSIKQYEQIYADPKVDAFILESTSKGEIMDHVVLLTQIVGRKKNPSVYYKKRTDSLGHPIVKRVNSYFKGSSLAVKTIGKRGGNVITKIIEMAKVNPKLTLEDFTKAFGNKDGEILFRKYSPEVIDDLKKALGEIGGELDALYLSVSDLNRLEVMASEIAAGSATIDSILDKSEDHFEQKYFVLKNMKSGDISKIKDWLKATTIMPADFPLKGLYEANLRDLEAIKDTISNKEMEELEYTLKFLPSY